MGLPEDGKDEVCISQHLHCNASVPQGESQIQRDELGRFETKVLAEQQELSQAILVSSLFQKAVAAAYSAQHHQQVGQKASLSVAGSGHKNCNAILELSSDDSPARTVAVPLSTPSVFQFSCGKIDWCIMNELFIKLSTCNHRSLHLILIMHFSYFEVDKTT